jgi:hypothetical protein
MKCGKILIFLLVGLFAFVPAENVSLADCYQGQPCYHWSGGGFDSLQQAIYNNTCVQIQAGTFDIDGTMAIDVPSGHTLTGLGNTVSTLRLTSVHDCPAPTHVSNPIIALQDSSNVCISDFRLTGSYNGVKQAVNGITVTYSTPQSANNNVVITNMQIDGVRCDCVSLGGNGTVLSNSWIMDCGGECNQARPTACDPGYGCGVHAAGRGAMYSFGIGITGNYFNGNEGTAVDIDGVDNGQFSYNSVWDNGGFAAFSLYGGHNWLISNNTINNSGGQHLMGHPDCNKGNIDIGILLCADNVSVGPPNYGQPDCSNNHIEGNQSQGYYGVLLIGTDTNCKLPKSNYLDGNDMFGSTIGCGDDLKPGQGGCGDNVWTNNPCRGTPNTPPNYF